MIKKIAGIVLVILGICGLFLPFLQGILMITAGLSLLGDKRLITLFATIRKRFSKDHANDSCRDRD